MDRIDLVNGVYIGSEGRQSLFDLQIPELWNGKVIVFIHGYMGYKDWGAWHLVQSFFVDRSYGFARYNASHNGGTTEQGIDFPDLESFAKNTYSKEVYDFEAVVSEIEKQIRSSFELYVMGHSRGGGIALLQAQHPNVRKIVTLAAISSGEHRFPVGNALDRWKSEGVYFQKKGRTQQEMPHHYVQFEDFMKNKSRLDIEHYCRTTTKPVSVIHGAADTSVGVEEGEAIAGWTSAPLIVLEGEAHTFGSKQPWMEKTLPLGLQRACTHAYTFFEA